MSKNSVISIGIFLSLFIVMQVAHAQLEEKITGPWLWMIAPTAEGEGGANAIDVDSLSEVTGGAVTEAQIAQDGANEGDAVGDRVWTLGELGPSPDIDNVQRLVNSIGLADGEIEDHSAYALITVDSAADQNGVTMDVGSDDAIKVWLNGEVVWTNAVNRTISESNGFQDSFTINLTAGANLLLVKVSERERAWDMYAGIRTTFDAAGKHYELPPMPGEKITDWAWMTVPTPPREVGCGPGVNDTDLLDLASSGAVTEDMIARNGVTLGDKVGDKTWTVSSIAPTGENNINDVITGIGFGEDDVNFNASYAFTYISSPAAQDTWMFVGSDDSIKVWINGEPVWNSKVFRGAEDFQEAFRVALAPGLNPLLVKVGECAVGWSMFVGFAAGVQVDQIPVSVELAGKLATTWGSLKRNALIELDSR